MESKSGGVIIRNSELLENLCVCEITFVHKYIESKGSYPMNNIGRYRYGLLYTVKGTEIYTFRDKTLHAVEDSVLIIPKDEAYRIDLKDEESVVITIDFEIKDKMQLRPFLIKFGKNNSVAHYFKEILSLWENKKPAQSPLLKSAFYKIISQLILEEISYLNSESTKKIADAVDYMHAHCLEHDFRIERLSEIAGISSRYFEKLFFKEYHTSPREYLMMYKTELAKEMLHSEKKSVSDVAQALGYNDLYHFSKLFKKRTGISPSECKRGL